uniref:Cilia- and flagella-associated protein 418 n=1 Tax=Hucho hucho TaxID=62062 RepID=A0A4W5LE66_9TELE
SEDVDALLEDLTLLDDDFDSLDSPSIPICSYVSRCCPVFLGCSAIANGVGTAVSQRSCDQLKCISCDFRVAMFDDHEWDPSCDYFFFRNNVPNCQKLRCSWHSALNLTDLREQHQLKWVCGKHDV